MNTAWDYLKFKPVFEYTVPTREQKTEDVRIQTDLLVQKVLDELRRLKTGEVDFLSTNEILMTEFGISSENL